MGKIKMSSSSQQLGEVSVTAVKPVIKQEVDRISYVMFRQLRRPRR